MDVWSEKGSGDNSSKYHKLRLDISGRSNGEPGKTGKLEKRKKLGKLVDMKE